jgi:hypothetical protein
MAQVFTFPELILSGCRVFDMEGEAVTVAPSTHTICRSILRPQYFQLIHLYEETSWSFSLILPSPKSVKDRLIFHDSTRAEDPTLGLFKAGKEMSLSGAPIRGDPSAAAVCLCAKDNGAFTCFQLDPQAGASLGFIFQNRDYPSPVSSARVTSSY